MSESTAKKPARKSEGTGSKLLPPKKEKDFPLQPHATGKWQKKIYGKTHYFGAWAKRENGVLVRQKDDGRPQALEAYNRFVFEQLHGKQPGSGNEGPPLMLGELVDMYLDAREDELAAGDIKPKTYREYKQACDLLVKQFTGKRLVSTLEPADFRRLRATLAKMWGIERLSKFVGYTKMPFTWGIDEGKIKHLVPFGKKFKKPEASLRRAHKEEGGERMFTPAEILELLHGRRRREGKEAVDRASPQLQAMILLGLNGGMGNTDVALLPIKKINLNSALIDFPRTKNAIKRRCPLWPETVKALKKVLGEREGRKVESDLVFLTRWGNPWVNDKTDSVGLEFGKRLKALHINGRRGLGFYSLRHTFRTIADETLDTPAIDLIMGHAPQGMVARYREKIDDSRLKAVTDHVRKWLFPRPKARKAK